MHNLPLYLLIVLSVATFFAFILDADERLVIALLFVGGATALFEWYERRK